MKKLILLYFIIFTVVNFAGDPSRKGTTGAEELLIPVGAQSIATSGAFVSNVTGLESIYYNPAGLDLTQRTEAMFNYMTYLADINISYFAIGTNLGDLGSVALSVKTLDFGDIPVTTLAAPDGDGTTYSPSFYTVGVTYSKIITDRISIGVNAKLISEKIMQATASGFALDFGVQYRFPSNLTLGCAVKNIGSNMQFAGQDLQTKTAVPNAPATSTNAAYEAVTEAFEIPSYFELSLGYKLGIDNSNEFLIGTTFRNNNSLEDQMAFGLQYGFLNTLFLRGGYDLMLQNSSQSNYGMTLGAGVNYNAGEGFGIVFDYAFRQVKDFPNPNHIFTIKLTLE